MTLYAILGHPRVVWAGKCFNPPHGVSTLLGNYLMESNP